MEPRSHLAGCKDKKDSGHQGGMKSLQRGGGRWVQERGSIGVELGRREDSLHRESPRSRDSEAGDPDVQGVATSPGGI